MKEFSIGILITSILIILSLFFFIGGVTLVTYGLNKYWLWSAEITGKQELVRAEGNRQIVVVEANAKRDSAKALAEAEIIRAEGMATANKILGDSLKGNEAYLRYLWIQGLEHTDNKVIYVPTEANLPILESRRLKE